METKGHITEVGVDKRVRDAGLRPAQGRDRRLTVRACLAWGPIMTQEAQIGQGVDLPPHAALITQGTSASVLKHLSA